MQILKDIYLTSGLPYGFHPNAYAVRGPKGVVLVDSGLDERDLAAIDANLHYWGLSNLPITHLLLTHAHFDHSGNALALRSRGMKTVAGPGDADGIELGDARTIPYAYGRKFPACPIDLRVKDGDVIAAAGLTFDVIHVPDHSSGSVFYRLVADGRVILFTGDVVHVGETSDTARLG
ncbi:MAG TPA: MBL fold metallo-hydrolase, partial [Anaerolineae bacterium]